MNRIKILVKCIPMPAIVGGLIYWDTRLIFVSSVIAGILLILNLLAYAIEAQVEVNKEVVKKLKELAHQ